MRSLALAAVISAAGAVALAGAGGCGKRKSSGAPPGDSRAGARLVSDAELEALAADVRTRLDANRSKRCPQGALRGQAVPGSADGELVALMQPTGALSACAKAVEELGPAAAELGLGRALDDAALMTPALAGIEARCAALPRAIAVAAARADACSPYLPGRRARPAQPAWDVLGTAAALIMRSRARAGDVAGALSLAHDVIRVSQSLARGGVDALTAASAATPADYALAVAEAILGSTARLSAADAKRLTEEAGRLLDGEPPPGELVAGDDLSLATLIDVPAPGQGESDGGAPGEQPGDIAGIALLGIAANARDHAEACSPVSSFDSCLENLARPAPATASAADRRQQLVDSERAPFTPPLEALRRAERRYVRLAALRLHVAAAELAASSRTCPDLPAFDQPPLAAHRKLPLLAAPLSILAAPDGRFIVTDPLSNDPVWQLDPHCHAEPG